MVGVVGVVGVVGIVGRVGGLESMDLLTKESVLWAYFRTHRPEK